MSKRFSPLNIELTVITSAMLSAVLVSAALLPKAAYAGDFTDPLYVGVSAGVKSNFKFSNIGSAPRDDDAKTTGKIYAGYVFNTSNVGRQPVSHAVELSAYTGKTGDIPFKRGNAVAPGSGEMLGIGLAYAAAYEVAPQISMTGRVGVGYTRSEITYVTGPTQKTNDSSVIFGLGAAYHVNDKLSLHADWDRLPVKFDTQKDKLNMFSIGARYKF